MIYTFANLLYFPTSCLSFCIILCTYGIGMTIFHVPLWQGKCCVCRRMICRWWNSHRSPTWPQEDTSCTCQNTQCLALIGMPIDLTSSHKLYSPLYRESIGIVQKTDLSFYGNICFGYPELKIVLLLTPKPLTLI